MVRVEGKIKYQDETLEYDIELDVEGITQDYMPIGESTRLIINAINEKYSVNFPLTSILNPVIIKK